MNPKGSKASPKDGPTFCHWCGKQLQLKRGGGYHFKLLLTPVDGHPVRSHVNICPDEAVAAGYKRK